MNAALFFHSFRFTSLPMVMLFLGCSSATAANFDLINPHWDIIIDDAGYSDLAFDQRPGFEGREYLSGEWAGAVSFERGGVPYSPTWLTPQFLFPDWTANSDFWVESPVEKIGNNSQGFEVTRSMIANGSLRIVITSQMIDTTNGIPQGLSPRSAQAASNVMSDRYVFRQFFSITNVSGETLTSLRFFQFLHALEASRVVYDDRIYGTTLNGHRYTISQQSPAVDPFSGDLVHLDTVALHANVPPSAWEAGRYGILPVDNHGVGKPSVGVHLSVEADSLSGSDFFETSVPWGRRGCAMRPWRTSTRWIHEHRICDEHSDFDTGGGALPRSGCESGERVGRQFERTDECAGDCKYQQLRGRRPACAGSDRRRHRGGVG